MSASRFGVALSALLVISLAAPVAAQDRAADAALADRMHGHIAFLADDALEGRETGTRGYEVAAVYVASQFQSLGLRPAGGQGWRQPVRLIERALADGMTVSWRDASGRSHDWMADTMILPGASVREGPVELTAPLVFVGHGVDAPEYGINDYEGLDVRDKIVVVVRGTPKSIPSEAGAHLNSMKGAMAQAHGAIGVLTVFSREDSERFPWETMKGYLSHPSMSAADAEGRPVTTAPNIAFGGYLHHQAAAPLFEGAPSTFDAVLSAISAGQPVHGFPLSGQLTVRGETRFKTLESSNVVGLLPGTDPSLADQPVMVTAHLDHIGVSEDESLADRISNGAMDNASGIAAMIEAARILKDAPTRRPVMFVALTAEESGLLGAAYMAANPLTPMDQVAALVNLDMPILTYAFEDIVAFGGEQSTLGELAEQAARAEGLTLTPDPTPEEMFFVRSDHYEFVKAGVPSLYLDTGPGGPGHAAGEDFLKNHYHEPSDDLNLPIDWNAAARFARLNASVIRAIGDAEQRPLWREDSFFGRTFAPNAPKAPSLSR